MIAFKPENSAVRRSAHHVTADELIAEVGAQPCHTIADLRAMAIDVFESDQELDEFLTYTYAERRRDCGWGLDA